MRKNANVVISLMVSRFDFYTNKRGIIVTFIKTTPKYDSLQLQHFIRHGSYMLKLTWLPQPLSTNTNKFKQKFQTSYFYSNLDDNNKIR